MTEDWTSERLEADSLLRSLYEAHADDEKHRKWLLRRWPEWPSQDMASTLPDAEIFIQESLVRDCEDDVSPSLLSIKNLVRKSVIQLHQEDLPEVMRLDNAKGGPRLSEKGLLEALPTFLPRLQRKALHSILSILSGRRREARNRPWLFQKINQEWESFVGKAEADRSPRISQLIIAVLRDPKSFQDEAPLKKIELEASCPWTAANSAFSQLDQLPLQCLQVMLEVLLGKTPELIVGKLPVGGNKERVITALLNASWDLLRPEQPGDPLPELLRKSLVVMSVSARYALGSDGDLISFLGPQTVQMKDLQDNLLSALSDLKTLNFDELQLINRQLSATPRLHEKKHPIYLRQAIRKVLLDCLLRSGVRSVPEEVLRVLPTIKGLAKQRQVDERRTKRSSNPKPVLGDDSKVDLEVEAMLRVSCHLQQIMSNWNEEISEKSRICSQDPLHQLEPAHLDKMDHGVETTNENLVPNRGEGSITSSFIRNCTDENSIRADLQVGMPEDTKNVEDAKDLQDYENLPSPFVEAMETHQLVKIADEASRVGYTLIGSAMEKALRHSGVRLKRPVRKYLRTGMKSKVRDNPGVGVQDDQLIMILSIAEKMPTISTRVMDNVKRRLDIQ